jgi:hypothetical protein
LRNLRVELADVILADVVDGAASVPLKRAASGLRLCSLLAAIAVACASGTSQAPEAGPPTTDAGEADAGGADAGEADAGKADAGEADAGSCSDGPDAGVDHTACRASYADAGVPNPDVSAVLNACPELASNLLWVDASNNDLPWSSWPPAMATRLQALYTQILAGAPFSDLACPDFRGADSARVWTTTPATMPIFIYFTAAQAQDMYLASVAHALALEVRGELPWSLLDYPPAELEPVFSARSLVVPVTQPPRPGGTPLPDANYQVPLGHDGRGFACDPRVGYDFLRGRTSSSAIDYLAGTPAEMLAAITFLATRNSVHGFPLDFQQPIASWQFTLSERLHRGLDEPAGTPSKWLIERVGCHSTAELIEELARSVNVPVRNLASYGYAWTDGVDYTFRNNSHRGLAFAWTRQCERRILPHADYANATALWPNFHAQFGPRDFYDVVWRTPESYQAMTLQIDMSMPVVPITAANSDGSYETYFDFGRVFAVLGTDEGRYWLRTAACSWDLARAYCLNPGGGTAAFAANNPYSGYPEFSDPALLKASFDATAACVAALAGGCGAVPDQYPDFAATDYLP